MSPPASTEESPGPYLLFAWEKVSGFLILQDSRNDLTACVRQNRLEHLVDERKLSNEVCNKLFSFFRLRFDYFKRLGVVYSLVERLNTSPHIIKSNVEFVLIKCRCKFRRIGLEFYFHRPRKIRLSELHHARREIAQTIRKVGIVRLLEFLHRKIRVLKGMNVPGEVVAKRVHTIFFDDSERVYHVAH